VPCDCAEGEEITFVDTTEIMGRRRGRIVGAVLGIAGLGDLLVVGVAAMGTAAPAGGAIRVFATCPILSDYRLGDGEVQLGSNARR
jgi:hypothetical protein